MPNNTTRYLLTSFLVASFAICIFGACQSCGTTPFPPAPPGPSLPDGGSLPLPDGGSNDPTDCSVQDPCMRACSNLKILGCPEGLDPSCVVVCQEAQTSKITDLRPDQIAKAKSIAEIRKIGSVACDSP